MINLYYFLGFCISIVNSVSIGKMPSFSTIGKTNYQGKFDSNLVDFTVPSGRNHAPILFAKGGTDISIGEPNNLIYSAIPESGKPSAILTAISSRD